MKTKLFTSSLIILLMLLFTFPATSIYSQEKEKKNSLDERVQKFLDSRRGTWRDMNVPTSDGKILYINHHYLPEIFKKSYLALT